MAEYIDNFYNSLQNNFEVLPARIQKMMPYMIADNWLLSNASIAGITKVLEGMNRRTNNKSKVNLAINEFNFFIKNLKMSLHVFLMS